MSRSEWTLVPGGGGYYRRGDDPIGVVESEREPGRYAPCYVATGEPAGRTDRYDWRDTLDDAIYVAEAEQRRRVEVRS